MGRSIYIDREAQNNRKRIRWGTDILLSLWVGIGFLATFITCFSLKWQWGEIFSGGIRSGTINLWNEVGQQLGQSDYYLLQRLQSDSDQYGLALLLLACISVLLALAIIRIGNRRFWILYLFPLLLVALVTSLSPHYASIIFLISGLIAAFVYMGEDGQRGSLSAVTVVLILALGLGGAIYTMGTGIVMPSAKAGAVEKTVKEKAVDLRYGKMPLGKGKVTGESRKKLKGTALEITMDSPKPMYLRGFVGENYSGGSWATLDSGTQYAKRQLDRRLWESGFFPLSSPARAGALLDSPPEMQTVSVKVVDGSGEYAFVPYEVGEDLIPGVKNVAGSYFTHRAGRQAKEYSYKAVTETIDSWPSRAGELFAASGDEKVVAFLHHEGYVNAFIYENYTEVEKEHRGLIYEELGTSGNQEKGHIDYKLAISNIRKYMDEQITYSEKGWQKSSGDGVRDFFQYKKGYDTHYATVATLMFRYYGIPARYVEGYLLTSKDVQGKSGKEAIAVPQKNVHAWTEIYIDGYGWVPVETCSEFYKIMPEPDLTKGLESESFLAPFEKPEQYKTPAPEEEVSEEEETGKGMRILLWTLLILLICLLLLVLIFFIRKLVRWVLRRRAFMDQDPKRGLCAIYGYIQEKKWEPPEGEEKILNRAAYSPHAMEEEDRSTVIAGLPEMRKRKKQEKRRDKKEKREARKRRRQETEDKDDFTKNG